jgi:replication-associated recombination protein RarA
MGYRMTTRRGYDFGEVSSALQKAIRRNDARVAGYFAVELFESGYGLYCWKRLLTISAEDCAGIITQEIKALCDAYLLINKGEEKEKGRIFIAKATIILCTVPKSRDADHLTNLVYDRKSRISDGAILKLLEVARAEKEPIPDYAFDCHTWQGKRNGKTKQDFIHDEFNALNPRQPGLFDADLKTADMTKPKL